MDVSGFSDVDRTQDPQAFVRYLEIANAFGPRRESTRTMVEQLGLRPGDHALDIGCGRGEGVVELAHAVGPTGRAVGADASAAMIAAAREYVAQHHVHADLFEADVYGLPFGDGEFAACMAGRLLQHLDDPRRAIREMARVTRAGGCVAVADVDWGGLLVDASDPELNAKVLHACTERIRSRHVGRQLHAMFKDCGLGDVRVVARAVIQSDLTIARDLLWFDYRAVEDARNRGVLSADEIGAWQEDLDERQRTGRFFAMIPGFLALGTKL